MINKWDPVGRRLLRERRRGRARSTSSSSTPLVAAARDPRPRPLALRIRVPDADLWYVVSQELGELSAGLPVELRVWLQEALKLAAAGLGIPAALLDECEWRFPGLLDVYGTTSTSVAPVK